MASSLLTSLDAVKAELSTDQDFSADNQVLLKKIAAKSAQFRRLTSRHVTLKTFTETIDGNDERIRRRVELSPWVSGTSLGGSYSSVGAAGYAFNLAERPVVTLRSLTVDGISIPQAQNSNQPSQVDGWVLRDKYRVELVGQTYCFTRGLQNIVVSYDAGHIVEGEEQVIPNSGQLSTDESFIADASMTFEDGTPMTKVSSAPAASQYSVSESGVYFFNTADFGKTVLITYASVPPDVEGAVIDMVVWDYTRRDHVGQKSVGLAGAATTYQTDDIPPSAMAVIESWSQPNV